MSHSLAGRSTRPPRPVSVPAALPDAISDHLGPAPTRLDVASWAQQLVAVLRTELDAATRTGVLSTAESELLLARLALVVDQAIGPG